MGKKKTKLMLYSTLVEIEVEVGVELGKNFALGITHLGWVYTWVTLPYLEV